MPEEEKPCEETEETPEYRRFEELARKALTTKPQTKSVRREPERKEKPCDE
jgi:hypothetical protein